MTFHLQKVMLMQGYSSAVAKGEQYSGRDLSLFKWDIPDSTKKVLTLKDIEVGYQILLTDPDGTYLRTSKIQTLVKHWPDEVIFQTETSLYRLWETDL